MTAKDDSNSAGLKDNLAEDDQIKRTKPSWQSSRRILRTFWTVAGAYWKSEEKRSAIGLLLTVVIAVFIRVLTVVILNNTAGNFFNSLQNKDQGAFYKNSMFVGILLSLQLSMVVLHTFCSKMLEIRWRRWLTNQYVGFWLADQAFYRLRFYGRLDNPDQRVSEDIRLLLSDTIDLTVGFLNTLLTVGAFAGVLYGLSGPIPVSLPGIHFTISGYLFWTSILYWLVGASLGYVVGNPLIWFTNRQQKLEADYRFALIRVREKAEAIALYQGQGFELLSLKSVFNSVNANSIRTLLQSTKLLAYQTFVTDAPSPLSFILCAPRFFSGVIPLGDMMRSANGFGQMSTSLSWIVNAYPTFADWHATVDRLAEFREDLEDLRQDDTSLKESLSEEDSIILKDVDVRLPEGRVILSHLSLQLVRGEHVLFKGESGTGKSTLFRVLAGIWPFSSGFISRPANMRALMLPQQPFIPIGTLRSALWFPTEAHLDQDDTVRDVLAAVNLSHLFPLLDEAAHWEQKLSIGEQQRLAIAQAILHKPNWLFLDEATAALDTQQEMSIYRTLLQRLPETTVISIGHRPNIETFHSRIIELPIK